MALLRLLPCPQPPLLLHKLAVTKHLSGSDMRPTLLLLDMLVIAQAAKCWVSTGVAIGCYMHLPSVERMTVKVPLKKKTEKESLKRIVPLAPIILKPVEHFTTVLI
jgi:hypothetical protein